VLLLTSQAIAAAAGILVHDNPRQQWFKMADPAIVTAMARRSTTGKTNDTKIEGPSTDVVVGTASKGSSATARRSMTGKTNDTKIEGPSTDVVVGTASKRISSLIWVFYFRGTSHQLPRVMSPGNNGDSAIETMATGNNACAMIAKMPAQQQQWHHPNDSNNNGKDASTTRVATPSQQGQRCQCNEDKDASTTTATMPAQQLQRG
jgi:hypothetical protein